MPRPKWDRQTAIEMGQKGRVARAARKTLCANIEQSLPALAHDLSYSDRLKARLRAQIELLLSRIDEEAAKPRCDGARADRLASALERLIEAERKADNRPLPGTLRPTTTAVDKPTMRSIAMPSPVPVRPNPEPLASPSTSEPGSLPSQGGLLSEPPEF